MEISPLGYLAPGVHQLQNHACVIPCGSLLDDSNLYWNTEQLRHYAKYIVNGQEVDDLFGSFVFNGIRMRDNRYIFPLFAGFGEPSDLTDWLLWADVLFLKDLNLEALAKISGFRKRECWVSIPYPHPFQRSFGHVGTRNLDFQVEADRLEAVHWWLDQFLKRWRANRHLHQKLNFKGFLWQRSAIDESDENLVIQVNKRIHRLGFLSMWLPNFGSYGVLDWKKWGFDVTAIYPNYSGNSNYDASWIKNASLFAAAHHTGIQLAWGKGLTYNENHHLDYWNLGLPDKCGYMTESYLVHHFPNQRLDQLYQTSFTDVIRLYTFVKGLYQRVEYPGIAY